FSALGWIKTSRAHLAQEFPLGCPKRKDVIHKGLGGCMRVSELKIGMVGLDTSHCPSFTKLLNNTDDPHHVPGGRVHIAYLGGSKDLPVSYERVDGFTAQLRHEFGIEIVDTIEEVAERSDAILLESVDGRMHLEEFRKLAPYGKPVFIDKPLTKIGRAHV